MLQFTLGMTMSPVAVNSGPPNPPEPVSDYSVTLNDFSRDRTIFDSGAHLETDPAAARVFISGGTDAPGGEVIQWRAVDVENGLDSTVWADATTVAAEGGSWSATIDLPRTRAWMRIEARVKGSVRPAARMTTRCAAGHVWAVWEQSNWARLDLYNSSQSWLVNPVVRPDDIQIAQRAGSSTGPDDGIVTPINDVDFVSPSIVDFANAFAAARPGEKLMVGWHAKGGTSIIDSLTLTEEQATYGLGGESARDWYDEWVTHRALIRDGSQVGVLWVAGWIASHGGGGTLASQMMAMTYLGKQGLDGTPVDARQPGVWRPEGVPRLFCAVTEDGRDFGHYEPGITDDGGLYDMRYTRLGWLGPHGRAATGIGSDETLLQHDDYAGYNTDRDTDYSVLLQDIDAVHNGNPAYPETLPWLGTTHGAERQDGDEAHMHATSPDGRQRLARIGMFYALKQLDLLDTPLPRLDQRYDAPDGSAAYFGIAGRDLTTERLWRVANGETLSNASDGSNPPPDILPELPNIAESHRAEVMGFSINGRPATDAIIYTVTAQDVLDGMPFAEGQKVARVVPISGSFAYRDQIIYGKGTLPGYQSGTDYDDDIRAFLNWLVVDMGQPDGILPRLPVQHQDLLFELPTTLPAPAVFTVDGATSWSTPGGEFAAETLLAVEVIGTFADVRNADEFIEIGNKSFIIDVANNGFWSAQADGTGSTARPGNNFQNGVGFHIRVTVDRNTQQIVLYDLTDPNNVLSATGTCGSGTFSGGSLSIFQNGTSGAFSRVALWTGTITPDWETATPDYGIDGVNGGAGHVEYGGLVRTGPEPG